MFCSNECSENSLRRYHKFECPIIDQLLKSGSVHMALRLFFIALSAFDGSIMSLKTFLQDHETEHLTVFDMDATAKDFEDDKKMLLALLTLTNSNKEFSLRQHEDVLRSHPAVGALWDEHQEFIKKFILRQCQISDWNFHGIFSGSLRKSDAKNLSTLQQSIGTGSFLLASLMNHSCANNILRTCVEGKIVIVVCRPIAAGAQLFDGYK
jgi:SET domain